MRFEPSQYQVSERAARRMPRLERALAMTSPVDEATLPDSALEGVAPGCCSALRTIGGAMEGLSELARALTGPMGPEFEEALALILEASGRVIVTGIGKSGHVGAKIAATLACTGTPAFFVHPAEASHGDLGRVTPDDVVLALSWSGETAELKSMVVHTRRFRIPLIAMTSRRESALAAAADVALILPRVSEAGSHGLAPTTSTLIQLALGDALAVALLEQSGFTADDFFGFHPGGSLGASLTRVRDVMRSGDGLPLVPVGTRMNDALLEMTRKGVGCLGVTDSRGFLAGIITDGDLRRHLSPDLVEQCVEDVMTRDPITVRSDVLVAAAIELLNRHGISALLVVDDRRPIGIVHLHDLLRTGAQ